MRVVADTTRLNYLILIGAIDVLPKLFDSVLVPNSVVRELKHPEAPLTVQRWIAKPPKWLIIHRIRNIDPDLRYLGAGEQEAIALALRQFADALLIDERIGRREAQRRNIPVVGTLALLDEADREHLLNFEDTLRRPRQTSFRLSPALIKALSQTVATQLNSSTAR